MTTSRIDALRAMVAKNPANVAARYGLANEALKAGLHAEARDHLQAYLAATDDEGAGYGQLAEALAALGDEEGARAALRRGIAAAERYHHASLAADLGARLDDLGGAEDQ